jgi:prepilin-type N-terminal cleavage/methylation domain-containing protein
MRRAFTLLELVLVLAIIVIVGAISVPVIKTMLLDARMNAGADMVRGRLADTRAKALDSGVPWKLAYMPNSGVIMLAAEDSPEWDAADQTPKQTLDVIRDTLPKDIIMAVNRDDIASATTGSPQASGGWQTLSIFIADGTARDDGTVYVGAAGLIPLRLRVRGLTGAVTLDVPYQVQADQ